MLKNMKARGGPPVICKLMLGLHVVSVKSGYWTRCRCPAFENICKVIAAMVITMDRQQSAYPIRELFEKGLYLRLSKSPGMPAKGPSGKSESNPRIRSPLSCRGDGHSLMFNPYLVATLTPSFRVGGLCFLSETEPGSTYSASSCSKRFSVCLPN